MTESGGGRAGPSEVGVGVGCRCGDRDVVPPAPVLLSLFMDAALLPRVAASNSYAGSPSERLVNNAFTPLSSPQGRHGSSFSYVLSPSGFSSQPSGYRSIRYHNHTLLKDSEVVHLLVE